MSLVRALLSCFVFFSFSYKIRNISFITCSTSKIYDVVLNILKHIFSLLLSLSRKKISKASVWYTKCFFDSKFLFQLTYSISSPPTEQLIILKYFV